jgi:transposase-like protein
MDKITDTKTEFRLKQWRQIIQSCQTSGMTVVAWCSQNNVNTKSYYYWLRRIRSIACESVEIAARSNEHPIVPVAYRQAKTSTAVTIHLPSISVDIQDGASRETIESVLAALKTLC